MKTFSILLFTMAMVLFSGCEKADEAPGQVKKLDATGILGTWEIQTYTANGITDMSIHCCEFTEFIDDDQPGDYNGLYKTYGPGYESNGIFTIDPDSSILVFGDSTDQTVYDYQIQNDNLTVYYTEDGDEIELTYIKRE